jgi:aminopeptidase-like protein
MTINDLKNSIKPDAVGREMYSLIEELFPICRSITGNGVRETLRRIQQIIPLTIHEVPSGTQVFDWLVPQEWNIRDAYVRDVAGKKVIDFGKSNLHILSYSTPIHKVIPLSELKEHLFTLPDHPEWIPYKTSYYNENWGFCISYEALLALEDGDYEVLVDSSLENGAMSYGEFYLPGEEENEVLVSCHICHPSLANDNLSGVSLSSILARHLSTVSRRFSYRFLFIPGTIGAIAWLALNEGSVNRIKHGLVVSGVGDAGPITYKKSRRGDAEIDRAALQVLAHCGEPYAVREFHPYGYDERQYCSPGFDLPVGRLSRTAYGEYPEYHTSGDNLSFIRPESLGNSLSAALGIMQVVEGNRTYLNLNPKCEPQLGKRGLYSSAGANEIALLWLLNLSDGTRDMLEIAERSGLNFVAIEDSARRLFDGGLLRKCR